MAPTTRHAIGGRDGPSASSRLYTSDPSPSTPDAPEHIDGPRSARVNVDSGPEAVVVTSLVDLHVAACTGEERCEVRAGRQVVLALSLDGRQRERAPRISRRRDDVSPHPALTED